MLRTTLLDHDLFKRVIERLFAYFVAISKIVYKLVVAALIVEELKK